MTPLNLFFAGVVRALDTVAIRVATRVLGFVVLGCVLLGAARGADVTSDAVHAHEPAAAPTAADPATPGATPPAAAPHAASAVLTEAIPHGAVPPEQQIL